MRSLFVEQLQWLSAHTRKHITPFIVLKRRGVFVRERHMMAVWQSTWGRSLGPSTSEFKYCIGLGLTCAAPRIMTRSPILKGPIFDPLGSISLALSLWLPFAAIHFPNTTHNPPCPSSLQISPSFSFFFWFLLQPLCVSFVSFVFFSVLKEENLFLNMLIDWEFLFIYVFMKIFWLFLFLIT